MDLQGLFNFRVETYANELLTTRDDILYVLYKKYEKLRDTNVVFLVVIDVLNDNENIEDLHFQPTQVSKDDKVLYAHIPWNLRNDEQSDVIILFGSFDAHIVKPYAFLKPMKECVVYFSP